MVNKEAEQSVLGALMTDPDAWGKICGMIREVDFFHVEHREIFKSMQMNIAEDKPIDPVTVADKAGSELFPYVLEIANNCPSSANIRAYADIVKTLSQKRQLSEILKSSLESVQEHKPMRIITDLMEQVEGVAHQRMGKGKTFADVLNLGLDAVEAAKILNDTGKVTGVPCGIPMLDKWMSGYRKSKLIIVAARPSVGKTAFTLQGALYAASQGYPVGIMSLEMADEELAHRAFANQYQINGTALSYGNTIEIKKLERGIAQRNIRDYPLYIDTDTYTLNGIVARANEWKRKYDIQELIVDHIGLVETDGDSKNERVGKVSRTLKKLSKKLDIPVIGVSQLNRDGAKNGIKPTLENLRDSGEVEQDADIVIFLHADKANEGKDHQPIEFGFGKHRGGRKGWMPPVFTFIGATQTIREIGDAERYSERRA